MEFGPVPLVQATGAVLAHSVVLPDRRLRKGVVIGPADIAALQAAGVTQVVVARPGPQDVAEDVAAERLALALAPDQQTAGLTRSDAFTGRVNLNATGPGVAVVDTQAVLALNLVHPAITLATLAPFTQVARGMLVGTVKIISYAVPGDALARAMAAAQNALHVAPVRLATAALLLTSVPGQSAKLNAKAREVIARRLEALGMRLSQVREVPHEAGIMAQALAALSGDMLLILTGSATSDLQDTAPAAVRLAGGRVERFGMPVDPGNLLFLGSLGARPVIGLPGCARSPALNGADWVLARLACGIAVSGADIAAMGVGGLLKEIATRPQPREKAPLPPAASGQKPE